MTFIVTRVPSLGGRGADYTGQGQNLPLLALVSSALVVFED